MIGYCALSFVDFRWKSLFIALIRLGMFTCDRVGYAVFKIILGEGVDGDGVGHEGGVVCGAEKFIEDFVWFMPFL